MGLYQMPWQNPRILYPFFFLQLVPRICHYNGTGAVFVCSFLAQIHVDRHLFFLFFPRRSIIFFFMTRSKTFITCDVRLTGLYCSGFCLEPSLWIGVTYANLSISGIFPSSILFLIISDSGSANASFTFLTVLQAHHLVLQLNFLPDHLWLLLSLLLLPLYHLDHLVLHFERYSHLFHPSIH